MTHKRSRSNISTGEAKKGHRSAPRIGGRDQWPVGLFFFNALAFESHQFIKMPCCISKMSPVAEKNSLSEKSCFSNFLNWKVAVNIWKHRAFARCFLCCIFHQHILVRAWGLEPQRLAAREPKGYVTLVKDFQSPPYHKGRTSFQRFKRYSVVTGRTSAKS